MELPPELFRFETLKYLPVQDILHLCQTNTTLAIICRENSTWQYLIGRDFGIEYQGENAKEKYFDIHFIRETDIPVSLVKQACRGFEDCDKVEMVLEKLGYTLQGNVYVLNNLNVEECYDEIESEMDRKGRNPRPNLLSQHVISDFKKYRRGRALEVFEQILPSIFRLDKHGISHMDCDVVEKFYNFYHGEGAFWKDFWSWHERHQL